MRVETAALWILALALSGCQDPPGAPALPAPPPPAGRPAAAVRPEAAPWGIEVDSTGGGLLVSWVESPDPTVLGYDVYRSCGEGGPIVRVNPVLVLADRWLDTGARPGFEYEYRIASVDRLGRSWLAPGSVAEIRP